MTTLLPRPALRPSKINKWIRSRFLSSYLYKIPRDQYTLDIACGWGFSFTINPNFYGVEIDDDCVKYCREHGYKVGKANLLASLPFADDSFDNCFSHDVLEHFELEELDLLFEGAHRVLRKGGVFMNIIPNKKGYDYGLRIDVGHKHFITPEGIRQIAARTGFEYKGAYSAPIPEFMNRWWTHAKYVTVCQKF